jgi:hypothetical protein
MADLTESLMKLSGEAAAEADRLTEKAVREWAAQVGITPECWLEIYAPKVAFRPGEGFNVDIVVTAVERNPDPILASRFPGLEDFK